MMFTRHIVLAGAAVVAVAVVLSAAPASAAPSATTNATFDIVGAGLDITAPATASLGSGSPGTAISGSLGTVHVSDARGASDASWTATVTATNFQTGTGTPTERVLASDIDYWSGTASDSAGNGSFVPGQATASSAQPLSNVDPLTAFTHDGGTGVNSVSWSPTLIVNVQASDEVGTYSGSVTHSVA
jgi:hypothetical protein